MADDANDLYRILIERDRERAKSELEKHKAELSVLVADAKVAIGDAAVQRMSAAIALFYKSAGTALVTLATLGGVGYLTLSSSAKQAIDAKLNDWLSVESKSSIVKLTLEKLRMRTVLDSLVVRLAREKIDGRSDMNYFLSEHERTRLLSYMQDPETSLTDFMDCARVLSASFGRFGVNQSYPDVDLMLKSVMGNRDFQNEKRLLLLRSLKGYPGLYGYAFEILKGDEAPDSWRGAAFDVVARYNMKEAAKYAEEHLLTEDNDGFQQSLALVLVRQTDSTTLAKWLAGRLTKDGGALSWVATADTIAPSQNFVFSENEASTQARRSGVYLLSAVESGARLANCTFGASTELCFEVGRRSYTLERPHALFTNNLVLAEIIRLAREKKLDLTKVISALTATGAGNEIYGIRVDLGAATLLTANYGKVDEKNTRGSVLLTSGKRNERNSEAGPVYASFRTPDGRWVQDVLISSTDLFSAKLYFAFDEGSMQAMEMRQFRSSEN